MYHYYNEHYSYFECLSMHKYLLTFKKSFTAAGHHFLHYHGYPDIWERY